MKESARDAKIVEWSEEDQCYVGSSPGLLYGGCHGLDEKAVCDELCQVVEEAIALYHKDRKPLPPSTSGWDFADKMQDVAWQRTVPPPGTAASSRTTGRDLG